MFPIIISTFLLRMMYGQIQGKVKHNRTYSYSFFIVCIEYYVAHMQIKVCLSCPHHIQGWPAWSGWCG